MLSLDRKELSEYSIKNVYICVNLANPNTDEAVYDKIMFMKEICLRSFTSRQSVTFHVQVNESWKKAGKKQLA